MIVSGAAKFFSMHRRLYLENSALNSFQPFLKVNKGINDSAHVAFLKVV